MVLTESDIDRIIEIVRADSHVRDRLRDAIVGDDFLALPGLVRQLVDHGHEVDHRIDQLTARMDQLAERMDSLVGHIQRMEGRVGVLAGGMYEEKFVRQLPGRLGRHWRKVRVVSPADLESLQDAWDSGRITGRQWDDVMLLDATAWAIARERPGSEPQLVAIEISNVIDPHDVERAHRRAGVLKVAGLPAVPAVGGQSILEDAEHLANSLGVIAIVSSVVDEPPR